MATVGPWTLEKELGRGGMGVVHRARDARGNVVALKLLSAPVAADARYRARFLAEAKAARAVASPRVVRLVDAGDERGVPWIAFELVPGGSLAERIKREKRLPWREAARLGAAISDGLEAIHAAGLVHRDLKPENVLLDAKGEPLISDLGLARGALGSLLTESVATQTGEIVGTYAYLAPEQQGGTAIDHRADLYALGATLFHVVAGRPPFEGRGLALLKQHALEAPPPLAKLVPGVPAELAALVARLLAKHPDDRPRTANDVARALRAIGGASARRRGVAFALAATVTLLGVGAAVSRVAVSSGRDALAEGARHSEAQGRHAEAIESWRRVLQRDGQHAEALVALGDEAARTGTPAELRSLVDRLVAVAPESADAHRLLALALHLEGDDARAVEESRRATELDPMSGRAWSVHSAALLARRQDALALAAATKAIERAPRDPLAWESRGIARLYARNLEAANADLDRALELDGARLIARSARAVARFCRGDAEGALADADAVLASVPRDVATMLTRSEALVALGRHEEALVQTEAALAREPGNLRARALRARSLVVDRHRFPEAGNEAEAVLAKDPTEPYALYVLGAVAIDRDEPLEAIRYAERVMALNPEVLEARLLRAHALGRLERWDEVIADCDVVIASRRPHPRAFDLRAFAHFHRGERDQARADADRAIALDPKNAPLAWQVREAFAWESKDLEGTFEAANEILARSPDEANARYRRGTVWIEKGNAAAARADFEAALRAGLDGEDAARAREWLATNPTAR